MTKRPLIVGIGGTTRPGSTAERAMLAVLAHAESLDCDTMAFGSGALPLEAYDPGRAERSEQAIELISALRRCDGVVIATPAYHGGVSGLMKNAIDFIEDMRADPRVYLSGRAVGCVVSADGPQAMGSTLSALRAIVHALRGWPTPYGAAIAARSKPFGGDGATPDPAALGACAIVAEEVAAFARMMLRMRAD